MIDKALRHVPTFEELVGILETDKTKIKLPHRTALHFFDSPLYQKVVDAENSLDHHETKVHHHHLHEREVVQTAAATGVSAAEVRTIMKEFQPAQPDVPMPPAPQAPAARGDDDEQPMDTSGHPPPPPGAGASRIPVPPVPQGPPTVFRPPVFTNPQPPPPPGPPPGAAAASLAANHAHEERMRQLEREAHLQDMADAAKNRENRANVAEAVTRGLIEGLTDAQRRAAQLTAARERAMQEAAERMQAEGARQAAERQRAHDDAMEQIRMAADAMRPRAITAPESYYIGSASNRRSYKNAPVAGDTTRSAGVTRKFEGGEEQPSRRRPRTQDRPQPPLPPPYHPPGGPKNKIQLDAAPEARVPASKRTTPDSSGPTQPSRVRPRTTRGEPGKRAPGYVPGPTDRTPAEKRSAPDSAVPTQPSRARPRTGGVVSKKVEEIETRKGNTKIRTVPVGRNTK